MTEEDLARMFDEIARHLDANCDNTRAWLYQQMKDLSHDGAIELAFAVIERLAPTVRNGAVH